jgi:hypothetical protein
MTSGEKLPFETIPPKLPSRLTFVDDLNALENSLCRMVLWQISRKAPFLPCGTRFLLPLPDKGRLTQNEDPVECPAARKSVFAEM